MNIKISKNTLQELCRQYDTVIINGKPTPTWSGILPYILDNIDDSYVKHISRTMPFIYGTDSDNKDVAIDFYNSTPTANALAMSDNNGCIKTNDPRQLKDCANKGYVDTAIETTKVEKITVSGGTITDEQITKLKANQNALIYIAYDETYWRYSAKANDDTTGNELLVYNAIDKNANNYLLKVNTVTKTYTKEVIRFEKQIEIVDLGTATSGTLTSTQLAKVVNNPNTIMFKVNNYYFCKLNYKDTSTAYYVADFTTRTGDSTTIYLLIITLSTGVWGRYSRSGELTSNKVTSISSSSTNTQYVTPKAVYDYTRPYIGDTGWKTGITSTKYRRIGQLVYVHIDYLQVASGTTTVQLGTLPVGYRPDGNFAFSVVSRYETNHGGNPGFFYFDSYSTGAGKITLNCKSSTSSERYDLFICFPTANAFPS